MMTPLSPDKYTVAWFTLAAFITRKEKERALGIYRLLAHSLHNEALAFQLEGDILLSFSDEKALGAYEKAAALYEKQNALVQAAAIYEHLITLVPDCLNYIHKLIQLYTAQSLIAHTGHISRALMYLAKTHSNLLERSIATHTRDHAELMLQESIALLDHDQHKAFVYAQIVLAISTDLRLADTAKEYITYIIRYYTQESNTAQLHSFLEQLLERSQLLYTYAHTHEYSAGRSISFSEGTAENNLEDSLENR